MCATLVLPTGVKSGKWHFFKWVQRRVLLKKSFFEKNVCHTGTSNGGKKWKMALFQVGSKNNTSIWDTQKKVGKAKPFRLKYSVINSYSENFALRNSRLRRAMWSMEIPLGHSISQARVLVQLPKPSSSIFATIFLALLAASGRP